MKNVTYHLLVNLSVSDLMITCLCGPVHVIHSLVMGEIFGCTTQFVQNLTFM